MFRTLQSRLMFFFIVISLGSIIVISVSIQFGFFGSFQEYIDLKRMEQVQTVIDRMEEEYHRFGTVTGETIVPVLHHYAMSENLFFKFSDQDNNVLFDSTNLLNMMQEMMSGNNGEKESQQIEVKINQKLIGYLVFSYPKEFESIDSQFLKHFNKNIIIAALAMIVISIIISFLLSKKLSFGLRRIALATRELQKNNLDVTIPEYTQVEEINNLVRAFNELALSLKNQEKLRKQFTNDLAHELRTPLATLRSQIEAFLDGVWEPTTERLNQGHGELMRLVRLVDDLEQLLAAENPQIQLHRSEVNVKKVFHSLRASFEPLFHEKKVELTIEEPDLDLCFYADQDRFYQIMYNLLNNAWKYTEEGGTVRVTSNKETNYISFLVEDTGQGISEEDLPYIFERFYRGEKSRNRNTGGVGIGLSIVKALVEAHKGKITVNSERNKGTSVKVQLPL